MTDPRILPGCTVLPPMKAATNGRHGSPNSAMAGDQAADKTGHKNKAKRKAGDRFACFNAFVDAGMAELKPVEQSVWFVLWRDTKPDGTAATSQIGIARRIGVSDRTVRRALDRLEHLGFLRVVRRGGVRQGASIYRVIPLPTTFGKADTGVRLLPDTGGHDLRTPMSYIP